MASDHQTTDAQIVQVILMGDTEAFEVLVDRYQRRIFNLALRMTHDRADAEEISQEVFLKLFQNLERYDPRLPLENWLMRIASNHTLNWLERRRVQTVPLDAEMRCSDDASPFQRTEQSETLEKINAALARLPETHRLAFALKFMDDYTSDEIADILERPRNTVKTWILRARASMREQLVGLRNDTARGEKE